MHPTEFPKFLKSKRLELGLTRKKLAEKIEMSPSVVYKWETETRICPLPTRIGVLQILARIQAEQTNPGEFLDE